MNAQVNEEVSVCSRYSKCHQWNSVLEAKFLENLVSCYPNTSGLDLELYFEPDREDRGHKSAPLLETPSWSLSLLEGDNLSPVKPVIIPIMKSSSKKKRTRSGHSIEGTQHNSLKKRKFVKTSHYNHEEDWSELYLMQDLSGERIDDNYSSSDMSSDSSSDESFDNTHVEESDEDQHQDMAGEELLKQTEIARDRFKAPVRDAIRRQIEQTKATDRWLVKFRLERDTWNKYHHPKEESLTLTELPVISLEDAINSCSVVTLLDKKNITGGKHLEQSNFLRVQKKPEKKKRVFMYEQKPFEDPKLEARRLKCLQQKTYDDKKRFNHEIVKVENSELRDENVRLRDQIQRLLLLVDKSKNSRRIPNSCSDHTVSDSEGSHSEPQSLNGISGSRKRGQ